MKEFPLKTIFAELTVKALISEEKDKFLSLASLVDVGKFIPNIDVSKNQDLLPVAFNACVINRVNKNMDMIDTPTAVSMYREFINKPINIEHNRQKVIGVILASAFSEFGTDKPLTEEHVRNMTDPFNVTLGGVIWRVVCPDLAELIEESSDPSSAEYLKISASWELGFTGYRIALIEGGKRNLSQATRIISDPKEVQEVQNKLISLGGDGKLEDLFAYRMPSYDVLPLGIGFTEKPAAEVKGIATLISPKIENEDNKPAVGKPPVPEPKLKSSPVSEPPPASEVGNPTNPAFGKPVKKTIEAEINKDQEQNKISQTEQSNVKIRRKVIMKITSLKDLTDEVLKECSASSVSDFIAAELKKSSDTWTTEKTTLNDQLTQSQANYTKLQGDLVAVQKQIESLSKEKAERDQVEKFNVRMSEVSAAFDLDSEVSAVVVEEIKAIASDEAWNKWMAKAKLLLKGYAKKAPPFGKKDDDKEDDKKNDKDKAKCKGEDDSDAKKKAKASESAASVVDSAIDNADKDKGGLPNSVTTATQTMKEKYATAFARENIIVSGK